MKSWNLGKFFLSVSALLAVMAAVPSFAQQVITIDSVSFPGPAAVTLTAVRYRPAFYSDGDGYSAVVMMHGCSGIWSGGDPAAVNGNGSPNLQNQIEKWGLQLAAQGIVALAVDSFTARKPDGVDPIAWQDHCSGSQYADTIDSYTTRVLDARAGWDFLAADARIDDTHIALLGWSHGAQAAMVESAVTARDADIARAVNDHRFVSTLLFYPGCGNNLGFGGVNNSYWRPFRDVMLHVGTLDSFHNNCQSRFANAVTNYAAVADSGHAAFFSSHADAEHSFDGESQTWPVAYCGVDLPSGDVCAMNAADIDGLAFLQAHLVDNDGDGVWDAEDAFPVDSLEWLDTDHDLVGNNTDLDDDDDGVPDYLDPEPLNAANGSVWPLGGQHKGARVTEHQSVQ